MKYENVVGVDPGFSGGISVLLGDGEPQVFAMPIIVTKKGKKKKTGYNLPEIVRILSTCKKGGTLFVLESVSSRPGEGTASSFNFGTGFGALQGIAVALGMDMVIVSPTVWKKVFPGLSTPEFDGFKTKAAAITQTCRDLEKCLEDKSVQKQNKSKIRDEIKELKQEIDRSLRGSKQAAKDAARVLVGTMYPKLVDEFKRKKDDGKAESVLISLYGRDHLQDSDIQDE